MFHVPVVLIVPLTSPGEILIVALFEIKMLLLSSRLANGPPFASVVLPVRTQNWPVEQSTVLL
jgi:hypothetical protein